jgi:hypothetical protein
MMPEGTTVDRLATLSVPETLLTLLTCCDSRLHERRRRRSGLRLTYLTACPRPRSDRRGSAAAFHQ